jgi:hypothetical protein
LILSLFDLFFLPYFSFFKKPDIGVCSGAKPYYHLDLNKQDQQASKLLSFQVLNSGAYHTVKIARL